MAGITLHNDSNTSATYVSNNFIDYYMTSANGEYVKIYLYLLRCMNSGEDSFSLSSAADRFEHTEKDVQRALKYWEKMKLLRLEYDTEKNLSGIHLLDSVAPEGSKASGDSNVPAGTDASVDSNAPAVTNAPGFSDAPAASNMPDSPPAAWQEPKKRNYTATELTAFQEKDNVSELLFVTEHYLKRPLTPTDIQTILFWFDELKFSVALIEYLIEYCVGKGHTSMRYMDKVALSWHKEGISTVEQAKRSSMSFSQLHFSVMRALGITGRNLIASETAYIDKWSKTYGFTQDIIAEACRRTIAATHQPSFEYTDGILSSWQKQGVRYLSDIAKLDSTFQKAKNTAALQNKAAAPNRFNNFSQRTYDYDQLEQQLLGKHNSRKEQVTCP